jgi:DnaJ-domain-containing protein 1
LNSFLCFGGGDLGFSNRTLQDQDQDSIQDSGLRRGQCRCFRSKWVAKKTTAKTKRMSGPSPWDVLGVPENADDRQVRRAYRSLALEFHPDKNSSPQAAAEFRRINEVN